MYPLLPTNPQEVYFLGTSLCPRDLLGGLSLGLECGFVLVTYWYVLKGFGVLRAHRV